MAVSPKVRRRFLALAGMSLAILAAVVLWPNGDRPPAEPPAEEPAADAPAPAEAEDPTVEPPVAVRPRAALPPRPVAPAKPRIDPAELARRQNKIRGDVAALRPQIQEIERLLASDKLSGLERKWRSPAEGGELDRKLATSPDLLTAWKAWKAADEKGPTGLTIPLVQEQLANLRAAEINASKDTESDLAAGEEAIAKVWAFLERGPAAEYKLRLTRLEQLDAQAATVVAPATAPSAVAVERDMAVARQVEARAAEVRAAEAKKKVLAAAIAEARKGVHWAKFQGPASWNHPSALPLVGNVQASAEGDVVSLAVFYSCLVYEQDKDYRNKDATSWTPPFNEDVVRAWLEYRLRYRYYSADFVVDPPDLAAKDNYGKKVASGADLRMAAENRFSRRILDRKVFQDTLRKVLDSLPPEVQELHRQPNLYPTPVE